MRPWPKVKTLRENWTLKKKLWNNLRQVKRTISINWRESLTRLRISFWKSLIKTRCLRKISEVRPDKIIISWCISKWNSKNKNKLSSEKKKKFKKLKMRWPKWLKLKLMMRWSGKITPVKLFTKERRLILNLLKLRVNRLWLIAYNCWKVKIMKPLLSRGQNLRILLWNWVKVLRKLPTSLIMSNSYMMTLLVKNKKKKLK